MKTKKCAIVLEHSIMAKTNNGYSMTIIRTLVNCLRSRQWARRCFWSLAISMVLSLLVYHSFKYRLLRDPSWLSRNVFSEDQLWGNVFNIQKNRTLDVFDFSQVMSGNIQHSAGQNRTGVHIISYTGADGEVENSIKRAKTLTSDQKKAIDAAMDDMSSIKRELMYWLFERFVLPVLPRALSWSPTGDIQDRPGYFRPGNWHWTMTKSGEFNPKLYTPPSQEAPIQRLPQAVIIGTGHCGTRALLDYLEMHPNIVTAHSEVHFFDINFHRGISWYREQMPFSYSDQITLEKSPSYVENLLAPTEIYKMDKNIHLILLVKDPVVRLLSCFSRRYSGSKRYPFIVYTNGTKKVNATLFSVNRGLYSVHIKKWLQLFPLAQLHVMDGGTLVKEPLKEVQTVEKLLGLPPRLCDRNFYFNATRGFYCMVPFTMKHPKCLGGGKGHPHVKLESEVKAMLYDFYRPYNEEFFRIIGKKFDWEPKEDK